MKTIKSLGIEVEYFLQDKKSRNIPIILNASRELTKMLGFSINPTTYSDGNFLSVIDFKL